MHRQVKNLTISRRSLPLLLGAYVNYSFANIASTDVPNIHHEGDVLVDAPSTSRVAEDNFGRIGESLGGGSPLADKNALS